ncbi:3,4-dihydroxy-2-butanone 4-phosphate synthase [Saccharolobus solfataricus]|uniref:GTP Cyclohydrolase II (3,4-Dihydroxy-2-Butanone 4-Phosphate Synthase (DHBP synthase) (RibA)) n=3 Tax=Saccharolobus solfataricus TaxID=2287 RepID=Q980B3_SACS2|nr:3,4-dihydroxy-2-butanone-4-phosphate synthase [Saccharolobus solfataricus]AAK40731.1 GTP Cyclohydrolase II (3,4-Dihydroxy-2-Butanone 4- Phosphate Synthase (DHBP synthase) (ribA) [Saccharolobus solfataricus P2]AKA73708.1 3,4-dihydroxy-2-butanone 4-phosphate synthase [Saccharolobus solfataricus]AKA76405.1 3,4-dihydroxy-2-butanone 4-phosphate synthase [Saccharolobus solfataricus]AKA79098.1 3,4-dihydroxy-2-butanone 4-phosphate synthase [Saccharolobus solfataricus]AZF68179.1 3,4-dihydroxy-2-buta
MDFLSLRKDLESGIPILIYDFDGREEETDMVFYAGAISWKSIYTLRKEAGGLICYATAINEAKTLGLNFIAEELKQHETYSKLVKKPSYGDYPAFSVWVNHVNTKTGISDYDRYITISELHKIILKTKTNPEEARREFYENFMTPGHVPILIARDIRERRGHTELSITLLQKLGLERSAVIAEILDEKSSMNKDKAKMIAKNFGLHFIEGKDIFKEVII